MPSRLSQPPSWLSILFNPHQRQEIRLFPSTPCLSSSCNSIPTPGSLIHPPCHPLLHKNNRTRQSLMVLTNITQTTNEYHLPHLHQLSRRLQRVFNHKEVRKLHQIIHHRSIRRPPSSHPASKRTHLPIDLTTPISWQTTKMATTTSLHYSRSKT